MKKTDNNTLLTITYGIGIIQMYQDFMRSDELDEKSKNIILLSLTGNLMWLIYQYRKYGMNFGVAYTFLSLFLQLFLLTKILRKERLKDGRFQFRD
jgi:hypothetical protein